MKLQQLRYIWEVSRNDLNISLPRKFFIPATGISKQIRLLEDELGVRFLRAVVSI